MRTVELWGGDWRLRVLDWGSWRVGMLRGLGADGGGADARRGGLTVRGVDGVSARVGVLRGLGADGGGVGARGGEWGMRALDFVGARGAAWTGGELLAGLEGR